MTLKSDAKFKEKLSFRFKYEEFGEFSPNHWVMGCFCLKYTRFELQKYRRVIFHDTETI